MDPIDFAWQIVQNQGIIALVLLWQTFQNSKERAALLHKNCELSQFIMKLLDRCLPNHEVPNESPPDRTKPS